MATVTTTPLRSTLDPLVRAYDVALLDLDGVVYVGPHAVAGVPESLAAVRAAGMRLAFVTNNAARTPAVVAEHLTALGVPADPADVITSAQSAAHYLGDRLGPGSRVLVIGTTGLGEALRERGLVPVYSADDDPTVVVQGYSPDLDWRQLAEGAVAIRRGLPWVATNADPTVPSARGPLPGNGSLVAALRHATGADPIVTGKPAPAMHLESVQRSGAQRPIVVGDRLDTDVQGANAVGCASLLVLTGVTSPADLLGAGPLLRPAYIAPDVGGLLAAHQAPTVEDAMARCGGWSATRVAGDCAVLDRDPRNGVTEEARGAADRLDPLRALCALAWSTGGCDDTGDGSFAEIRAGDEAAANTLRELGLGG